MTSKYFVAPKPAVKTYPDGREICLETKGEYLFRLNSMRERQCNLCAICRQHAHLLFDHEAGRGSGGGHRDDRIEVTGHWQNAALCYDCNQEKGSKRYHWVNGVYEPVKSKA